MQCSTLYVLVSCDDFCNEILSRHDPTIVSHGPGPGVTLVIQHREQENYRALGPNINIIGTLN